MFAKFFSLLALSVLSCLNAYAAPMHVYLTWQGDTSTTMTVNFHTQKSAPKSAVYYDTVSRNGDATAYARSVAAASHQIEGLKDRRHIQVAELTELKANTTYYFVAGDKKRGFSSEMKFRTVPSGDEPIQFVTGGDMDVLEGARKLLRVAAKESPLFCLIGGDIAYANGALGNYKKWDIWLDNWEELMVTPGGYQIPIVASIGNHEVQGHFGRDLSKAPFFMGYLAQAPVHSYFSRTFGDNIVLFTLDSGHATPHAGEQSAWLEKEMAKYADVKYRFALYHVPLYTSFRPFKDPFAKAGRESWGPTFDKYHLTTGFENHDHTHKRTKLLRGNKVDPEGTLYIGNGCFGTSARPLKPERRWYEEKALSIPHVWSVRVTPERATYRALDSDGNVFDDTETLAD